MIQPGSGLPASLEADLVRAGRHLASGTFESSLFETVLRGLGELPPESVTWADASIASIAQLDRRGYGPPVGPTALRSRLAVLDQLYQQPDLAPLYAFHRDGFVREAALDRITVLPASPFFLAALAWRLNDWVPAVRAAAGRCAGRVIEGISATVAAGTAPFLLTRLDIWKRWGEADAALIERLLGRSDVARLVARQFMSGTAGPLATLLRQALRSAALDEHLVPLFHGATQPAVRATALQVLVVGRASWPVGFGREWIDKRFGLFRRVVLFAHRDVGRLRPLDALIHEGLRDRSPAVRRVAADALIQNRTTFPHVADLASSLVADRSRKVRERGEFLLRQA